VDSSRYEAATRLAQALSEAQSNRAANDVAGVLTSVDEDPEDGEEAECPREFDYYSDEEEEGDAMES
jgi:26S proteasome regulatory subunit N2